MIGSSLFLGDSQSATQALVQIGGDRDGYKMSAAAFMSEMERRGPFYNRAIRYHQALSLQIQQTTACNALHPSEQRCCRWLLMSHDRVGADDLKLTHEFLAIMLGVRRPTVTLLLGQLHRAGLVASEQRRPGTVTITNRKAWKLHPASATQP
jgi:CRP-like cAMP-binding protein